jgi:GNAT superfamily N-acetyltransferase
MLVGVGRYQRFSETEGAEVAFVVADKFQHNGIGSILVDHLADAALSTSNKEHGTVSVPFVIHR